MVGVLWRYTFPFVVNVVLLCVCSCCPGAGWSLLDSGPHVDGGSALLLLSNEAQSSLGETRRQTLAAHRFQEERSVQGNTVTLTYLILTRDNKWPDLICPASMQVVNVHNTYWVCPEKWDLRSHLEVCWATLPLYHHDFESSVQSHNQYFHEYHLHWVSCHLVNNFVRF